MKRVLDAWRSLVHADFRDRSGAEVRGDAAIDHVEHEHRLPLVALGGQLE